MSPGAALTFAVAFAALVAAGMLSHDVGAQTNCLRLEDARAWLWKHHGEREVWEDPTGTDERVVIFRNSQTGSATVLRLFENGTACLLDDGRDI
jgi:hypothetical protein